MNRFFYIVFPLIIISIYFNFSVYQSHILQRYLIEDFNSGNYREITTASFETTNLNYPNLTVTAIPIKHLVSRYYFLAGQYEKAFSLIEEGNKANPYFQLGNVLKSEYFEHLDIKDSMSYYGDLAFKNAPKNIRHFMAKIKSTSYNKDLNELIKAYNLIKNQDNYNFHLLFLSSLISMKDVPDSIKSMSNEILNKFPDINEINVARDMVLYGKENIEKSINEAEIANKFFGNGQLYEALNHFKAAIKFNPGDYVNYENCGLILLQLNKPKEAITYLNVIIDSLKRSNKNGKTEYLIGKAYLDIDNKDLACNFFKKSKSQDNPIGTKLFAENCNN